MKVSKSIDEHIQEFSPDTQSKLQSIRQMIQKSVPEAVECIKYGIPTYTLYGKNLVHFAGYKGHIGFYPAPSGIARFKDELKPYIKGKGTLQFPLDTPLPLALVRKIVLSRVKDMQTTRKK